MQKKIVHINNVLYHYRQRKSSVVQTEKNLLQITNDAIDLRIERFEWIKRHFPKLKNIFLFNDINFLLYFYENAYFDKSAAEKYKKPLGIILLIVSNHLQKSKLYIYHL